MKDKNDIRFKFEGCLARDFIDSLTSVGLLPANVGPLHTSLPMIFAYRRTHYAFLIVDPNWAGELC